MHALHASFLGIDWGTFLQGFLLYLSTYFGSKHGSSGGFFGGGNGSNGSKP
jgi:hypothetical protein